MDPTTAMLALRGALTVLGVLMILVGIGIGLYGYSLLRSDQSTAEQALELEGELAEYADFASDRAPTVLLPDSNTMFLPVVALPASTMSKEEQRAREYEAAKLLALTVVPGRLDWSGYQDAPGATYQDAPGATRNLRS